jgi:hypothetical protein
MTMKKNSLLIAVASAALAVGSGTAFAQGMQGGPKADSPAVQSNPASKNAPAEKIQGAEHRGAKPETTGQGASERGQKMGQETKEPNKLNKSTTGQAPIEPKSGQANERRDNKMGQDEKNLKNKSTTGQAPSQQTTPRSDRTNNANERTNDSNRTNSANEPNRMNSGQTNERGGATENRSGAAENRGSTTNVNVNLSSEQRTRIHSIIVADRSAPRVAHVDFDVNVGTVVPRGRVKFVPLPTTIVEIEPSWRGFEYFLVGDELVVVDPATLRIVAVLPA